MADICVLSNKCFPSFNLDVFDDRNPNSEDEQKNTDDDFGQKPVLWCAMSLFKFNSTEKTVILLLKYHILYCNSNPTNPLLRIKLVPKYVGDKFSHFRLLKSTWPMVRAKIGEKLISSSFELSQDHIHIPTCDIGSFGGFLSYLRVPLYHQLNFFRVNWKISSIFRTIITAENCSHRLWVIGSTLTVARL